MSASLAPEVIERLLQDHQASLRAIARMIARDSGSADDMMQDGFVDIWRGMQSGSYWSLRSDRVSRTKGA